MKIGPRKTPSRDEKYMGLAFFLSSFSKDPKTQHGAVIITPKNKPLGWGYNGPPSQINDEDMDWDRPAKYPLINHSERNAIDHSKEELLEGAILYTTGKPCEACMLDIVANGIRKVVYYDDKCHHDLGSMCVDENRLNQTDKTAELGGVILEKFNGSLNWMNNWNEHLKNDLCLFGIFP